MYQHALAVHTGVFSRSYLRTNRRHFYTEINAKKRKSHAPTFKQHQCWCSLRCERGVVISLSDLAVVQNGDAVAVFAVVAPLVHAFEQRSLKCNAINFYVCMYVFFDASAE